MLLSQKVMAATLGSPQVKSVCNDSLFTAISGQAHTGEERFLGLTPQQHPEQDEAVCLNLCPPENEAGRI